MLLLPVTALPSPAEETGPAPSGAIVAAPPAEEREWVRFDFEPDAYYTNLDMTIALTSTAVPHVGEQSEKDLYLTLLSRAYAPRFLVVEGSVNPLPYLGTYIRDRHGNFYDDAQVTGSFNWVTHLKAPRQAKKPILGREDEIFSSCCCRYRSLHHCRSFIQVR
ncbi:MAG: hypothetical protein M0042_00190, partial [Nitrospiraceae bacterium]|nr:hypothetical protein [Nitrospiraceae bacterium]